MSKNCKSSNKLPLGCGIFVGAVGPTGPTGSGETISIRDARVAEPFEDARVIDNFSNNNHTLDFVIPRGKDGNSFNILGYYDTFEELQREHGVGNIGDGYLVDGNLYVWADNTKSWQNVGEIRGPQGEQGPPGMGLMKSCYVVTFNNGTQSDGIAVMKNGRIPLARDEINIASIINLDNNTIKLNESGYYKITFTVSAYPEVTSLDFDPSKDFVSVGFREVNTDNVYVGTSGWVYNGEAAVLMGQGIISAPTNDKVYEFVNLSNSTIYLSSPDIRNISSSSYFSNCLVTVVIDYLGSGV